MPVAAPLREGFSTGTAATGAALAALRLLLEGRAPASVRVPLPPFRPASDAEASAVCSFAGQCPRGTLVLQPEVCAPGPAPCLSPDWLAALTGQDAGPGLRETPAAHASIRKDGGDDPDATSGALITATVLMPASAPAAAPPHPDAPAFIRLEGGPGVGRATLPGLPIAVGQAAINPVPEAQIRFALGQTAARLGMGGRPCPPLLVVISVQDGESMARHTLNPRLGIVGGISILGTQGTVRPYSHEAWKATILQGLRVAQATGCRSLCLSTGRRSERLLMARYPALPPQGFVQAADFVHFSLEAASRGDFDQIIWGCFFGKLLKLTQGHGHTHAHACALEMSALAAHCRTHDAACAEAVGRCLTAAHALELILADAASEPILTELVQQAATTLSGFAGRAVRVHLFHIDGRELIST